MTSICALQLVDEPVGGVSEIGGLLMRSRRYVRDNLRRLPPEWPG